MTEFEADFGDVFRELDRLERLPEVGSARLDIALETMFQATQADVPVDTGRLKSSGQAFSAVADETWIGTISYGRPGDAEWKKNPRISYAVFVQEDDDFMRATRDPILTGAFREAIAEMLDKP